jgi:hypothetical protein
MVPLGGDPEALISFPVRGGEIRLPLVSATRAFYRTAGWIKTRDRIRAWQKKLGTQLGLLEADPNTLYRSVMRYWSGQWFVDLDGLAHDGLPIYEFEVPLSIEKTPGMRGMSGKWVVAVAAERPKNTGRQAFRFIMKRPKASLLSQLLTTFVIPFHGFRSFVRSDVGVWITDTITDWLPSLKTLICGPAQPYIDDLVILIASGPAGLAAAKGAGAMTNLSNATGKSEAELTKAAADPKGTAIESITNALVGRICASREVEPPPPEDPTPTPPGSRPPAPPLEVPPGSVAIFDTDLNQYRIVSPPIATI